MGREQRAMQGRCRDMSELTICPFSCVPYLSLAAELNLPRYKFMVHVVVGEARGQGVRAGTRSLWDATTDTVVSEGFQNVRGGLREGSGKKGRGAGCLCVCAGSSGQIDRQVILSMLTLLSLPSLCCRRNFLQWQLPMQCTSTEAVLFSSPHIIPPITLEQ